MNTSGARILVVDDEVEILRILRRSLSAQGYRVLTASSGKEAIEEVVYHRPDIVLLDLGLPDRNGLDVCQRIREQSQIPILVVSAHATEREKVEALEAGADDYITKPFGIEEILARIRVVLRRLARAQGSPETPTLIQIGSLQVDLARRLVQVGERRVTLTPTEYDLLKTFVTRRGQILTRQQLLQLVWGSDTQATLHTLHVYVAQLRRKIEPDPQQPRFILNVPGVGYRLSDEEQTSSTEQESMSNS